MILTFERLSIKRLCQKKEKPQQKLEYRVVHRVPKGTAMGVHTDR